MLLYNARKYNSGFTLIEMLIVTVIIGVIAAIAASNLLGLLNRNRVNQAARQVEGALKEAQRQAISSGKQCSVEIDTTNKIISNPAGGGCLLDNRSLNDLIQLNSNTATITFSGKGNITVIRPVVVVSMPNGTDLQRCVVIDSLLGSQRSGEYSGNPATPTRNNCQ